MQRCPIAFEIKIIHMKTPVRFITRLAKLRSLMTPNAIKGTHILLTEVGTTCYYLINVNTCAFDDTTIPLQGIYPEEILAMCTRRRVKECSWWHFIRARNRNYPNIHPQKKGMKTNELYLQPEGETLEIEWWMKMQVIENVVHYGHHCF